MELVEGAESSGWHEGVASCWQWAIRLYIGSFIGHELLRLFFLAKAELFVVAGQLAIRYVVDVLIQNLGQLALEKS